MSTEHVGSAQCVLCGPCGALEAVKPGAVYALGPLAASEKRTASLPDKADQMCTCAYSETLNSRINGLGSSHSAPHGPSHSWQDIG